MTTRRKPRKWTDEERSAIIEFCKMRSEDSEKAVTRLKSSLRAHSVNDMVWQGIRYWTNVGQGYKWGLGLLEKGAKNAGQRQTNQDGGSKRSVTPGTRGG